MSEPISIKQFTYPIAEYLQLKTTTTIQTPQITEQD